MIKAKLIHDRDKVEYIPIMGGLRNAYRWHKFLNMWDRDFRHNIIAMKNALIDAGLVPSYGMDCSNEYLFEFSDGSKAVGLSMRAWGDFISAIVGKKEGYMAYY